VVATSSPRAARGEGRAARSGPHAILALLLTCGTGKAPDRSKTLEGATMAKTRVLFRLGSGVLTAGSVLVGCGGTSATPASQQPPAPPSSVQAASTSAPAPPASVGVSARSAPVPTSGPAAVALRYIQALNRGDANAAAAFFSDDAVLVTSAPCLITTPCKDHAAILKRAELVVSQHTTQDLVGSPAAASASFQ